MCETWSATAICSSLSTPGPNGFVHSNLHEGAEVNGQAAQEPGHFVSLDVRRRHLPG